MALPMSAVHARKCQFIKVNGLQCGSPALRGHQHCYFHYDIRRTTLNTVLPILEDATAIQAALDNLATWIIEKRLEPVQINQLLWLMKIAAFNARKARIDTPFKDDIVTVLPDEFAPGLEEARPAPRRPIPGEPSPPVSSVSPVSSKPALSERSESNGVKKSVG